jgi:hypothetical protein
MSIKQFVAKQQCKLDEQDRQYPNRYKQIHKTPCKLCPSKKGSDPEAESIKCLPKEFIAKEFLFVCAWRVNKLCKGNCDEMSIDQHFLDNLYEQ